MNKYLKQDGGKHLRKEWQQLTPGSSRRDGRQQAVPGPGRTEGKSAAHKP